LEYISDVDARLFLNCLPVAGRDFLVRDLPACGRGNEELPGECARKLTEIANELAAITRMLPSHVLENGEYWAGVGQIIRALRDILRMDRVCEDSNRRVDWAEKLAAFLKGSWSALRAGFEGCVSPATRSDHRVQPGREQIPVDFHGLRAPPIYLA
jgi:hypothetical protein